MCFYLFRRSIAPKYSYIKLSSQSSTKPRGTKKHVKLKGICQKYKKALCGIFYKETTKRCLNLP